MCLTLKKLPLTLRTHRSLFLSLSVSNLVEATLIQTLALTEENQFWLKPCSEVHRRKCGFRIWSWNPPVRQKDRYELVGENKASKAHFELQELTR